MKKILVLGAGKSSSSLIKYLLDNSEKEEWFVTVADVSLKNAEEKINDHKKGKAVVLNIENETERRKIISENDIVVFCHDDLKFDTTGWMYKIESHFKKNPDYGIIGLAGSKYMPISGRWWEIQSTMFGIVNHESEGKKWESKYSKEIGNKLEPTIIVDGLFFAVNKKNVTAIIAINFFINLLYTGRKK